MKALFFRNLFRSEDGKEDNQWFHQATLYLASAYKKNDLPFSICKSRYSFEDDMVLEDIDELEYILEKEDIGLVVLTLIEWCFDKTLDLAKYIKERSNAVIVLGGLMPTHAARQVISNFPYADILVRGDGEEILPEIHKILSKHNGLNAESISELIKLNGLRIRNTDEFIESESDSINCIEDMDSTNLDFSLLGKENVTEGLNFSTSRGCGNSCFFCTMPSRGKFRGKSVENIMDHLKHYRARLIELFGNDIPRKSLMISFNDDDFTSDRNRAIEFFKRLRGTEFKINYIQVSINSFWREGAVDTELVEAMDPSLFNDRDGPFSVYLGTENLVDEELKRLGKGNSYEIITSVIKALSQRGIRQAHHLIFTNVFTTLDNICENLVKVVALKRKFPEFNILTPVISNLVSFYPTASYRILEKKGLLEQVKVSEMVGDYPVIEKDIPLDEDVVRLADMSPKLHFGKDYSNAIEGVLLYLIRTYESLNLHRTDSTRMTKIKDVLDKYYDYESMIEDLSGIIKNTQKNNIQLMVTRRCPLRCSYCPVPKKDADMTWDVMKSSIDLLFKSDKKNLRLDFTGGEPLLMFDLLKKGMDYAMHLAEEKDKKISFYIVTNALLLTDVIANYLDGKDVLLELSIDGPEDVHNECKIPIEDINPYQTTTNNIKNIRGKDICKYVVLVATTNNVARLKQSFDHVISLGINSIDINYAIGEIWDEGSVKTFFSEMDKIIDYYTPQIRDGDIIIGNFKKRSEPAVLNTEFMIDTDGEIRLLNEFLLRSESKVESPYSFGKVTDAECFKKVSRFNVYYSLVAMFEGKLDIIRNNINIGMVAKRYFRDRGEKIWKENYVNIV